MGVGDVGAVPDGARGRGHAAGGDDGGGAVREHEPDDVGGRGGREHGARVEPGRDGVGVGDGARGKPGAGGVHVDGAIRGDGVRGDGVGVGDVGAVFGWTRHSGHAAGGDDGRRSSRQRDRRVLAGFPRSC